VPGGAPVAATPAPVPGAAKPEPPAAPKSGDAEADASSDCVVVYDTHSVQAGFDVTYELDGAQKVVRMDRDPGKRIPVEDGELVLTQR